MLIARHYQNPEALGYVSSAEISAIAARPPRRLRACDEVRIGRT
jgi:hypothetical protein